MVNFQDLIDKVKGKKSVKVKEHHRKQNNKDVVVDDYTKLVDKEEELIEPEQTTDPLDNLDSP